jgi:hypothetical protein
MYQDIILVADYVNSMVFFIYFKQVSVIDSSSFQSYGKFNVTTIIDYTYAVDISRGG